MHYVFSPFDQEEEEPCVALPLGAPFDHNPRPLEITLLQQEQGKHKTTEKQSYFFFFNSEVKLKKKLTVKIPKRMIKQNSLELVMRVTSVPQVVKMH